VDIRGKLHDVRIVATPFVRHGKIRIDVGQEAAGHTEQAMETGP